MSGKFIVIEGGDGSGKTTLCDGLMQYLGESAVRTREPGGTPFSERARQLLLSDVGKDACPEAQLLLMYAARVQHLKELVLPQRAAGKLVISDRFHFSSLAYQVFGAPGGPREELQRFFWDIHQLCVPDPMMPDLIIFLDVAAGTGMRRMQKRGGEQSHFDVRPLNFHEALRKGYHYIAGETARLYPNVTVCTINAEQTPEQVFAEALKTIKKL